MTAAAPPAPRASAAVPPGPLPAHELAGPEGAPLVVVLGGISSTSHVCATPARPEDGWWDATVGPGRAIDTRRFRVLGVHYLDGGRGPTGRPERVVTTHDQADAVARLLDALGVEAAHAVVGASYGGMVGLALAEHYPERLRQLVVFSAAHESHPMSTALRAMQRRVVELGLDTGRADDAMALARGVAMTTYRTADEFAERFDDPGVERSGASVSFAVERYLEHAGRRFAALHPPERFLALSLSADLHRVDPAAVHVPTLLVAAEGDTLVPGAQMTALAAALGAPCTLAQLATRHGHDAFLTEPAKVGPILTAALSGGVLA